MANTDDRPLATANELCAYTGMTPAQAAQHRYRGTGPRFIRLTGRQVRYRWSDIQEWLDRRTVTRADELRGPGGANR